MAETAYVADLAGNLVYVYSVVETTGAPLSYVASIAMPGQPWGIAVSPVGNVGYVSCCNVNEVVAFNTITNQITATYTVGSYPEGVAVHPTGQWVYAANYDSNTVSVINTVTGVVTSVAVGTEPVGVTVAPNGVYYYVACSDASNAGTNSLVYVFDCATNAAVAQFPLGAGASWVAVTPDSNAIFVAAANANEITVFSMLTWEVGQTIGTGAYPQCIALSPNGQVLVTANAGYQANTLSFVNLSDPFITISVGVGPYPVSVAFSNDGSFVFAADNNPAGYNVTVVQLIFSPYSVSQIVGVGSGVLQGIAVSPLPALQVAMLV